MQTKLRDDIRYAANLLDGDSQLLSTGEALLRPSKTYGVFWPRNPIDEELILKSAKILQVSGEVDLKILKVVMHQTAPHSIFRSNLISRLWPNTALEPMRVFLELSL